VKIREEVKTMSKSTKKILAILALTLVLAIALGSLVVAYAGGIRGIGLLGVWFFLTFGIIVVLGQMIPAGILLSSFIGSAITPFRKGEIPIRAI
jgi:pheromone shutdown protein TraB